MVVQPPPGPARAGSGPETTGGCPIGGTWRAEIAAKGPARGAAVFVAKTPGARASASLTVASSPGGVAVAVVATPAGPQGRKGRPHAGGGTAPRAGVVAQPQPGRGRAPRPGQSSPSGVARNAKRLAASAKDVA